MNYVQSRTLMKLKVSCGGSINCVDFSKIAETGGQVLDELQVKRSMMRTLNAISVID